MGASLGLPTKPKKIPPTKFNTKKIPCRISKPEKFPEIYLFIYYLFIYRFVQCTGERTIGHVVPYLVHPPNPTP